MEIKDKKWLVGYLESNSFFDVHIKSKLYNSEEIKEVMLEFRVEIANLYDVSFLYSLKKFFGCGQVLKNQKYVLTKLDLIETKILPFFDKYKLQTTKKFEYFKFKKCVIILKENNRLKDINVLEIENLWLDILKYREKNKDKVQNK